MFKEHFLFEKDFFKTVFAITLPIAMQNVISFGVNAMDSIMLGSLGDIAVSVLQSLEILWTGNASLYRCCKLYKKSCFENIRYPVGKLHEDEYTTYKILFQKNSISYLEEPLYFYFTNPNSIMNSDWSPKRLDAITAYEEQIAYFRKSGHRNVMLKVERKLLWYIIDQIEITEKTDEYAYLTPELKKRLRTYLKKFKADANLSLSNGYDFYIKAYPTITKLYCIVLAILKKLKILRR